MKINSQFKRPPINFRFCFYGTFFLLLVLVSCKAPKYEQTMFKTPYDEAYDKIKKDKPPIIRFPSGSGESDSLYQYRIRIDDVINVRFLNQATNQLPDPIVGIAAQTNPVANVTPASETTDPSNYIVDVEGNILLPLIGSVKAVGLTTLELRKNIQKLYEQYYVAPEIDIRILNLRVTVIGEVRNQGIIT
ncbi:MAG: polysaccharide biosynthesis/export family protein, partial [Bacteroidia bacterium]|nr:polysaccharide biosynthesis/export family protein [Bacteroidia bacterium]